MTYLLYTLWFVVLLWVAAEVDRLLVCRFWPGMFAELRAMGLWFLPPVVSALLPGGGQLLNGQAVKALLCLAWPLVLGLIPRPWQMVRLATWELLIVWYPLVLLDALVTGMINRVGRRHAARVEQAPTRNDLTDFLARRQAPKGPQA